ncbi:MAG: AbrB/MazE/SpoVT family DNA-binding domain-containing protein [Gammaproteobacteria bacterium]|nr:AbrB/MazE/SpoVT family DNA-binding domain-containing protein [Gammaproteobacteria bacterium]MBU1654092.1 AbrB/MazE/SpoVT family DNA-binding domain-containing protein [Gammaproteobacteria bacterium]MBU1961373.1 AbrB/MazE/SpoVT family DNA-binding domain-containing protein [Gammaproteobacteria bacterium]
MIAMRISEGGRVVIPAEIRRALHLSEGDTVLWELKDGEARLTTRRAKLERARNIAKPYLEGWTVDDFLAARHRDAEAE